MSCAGCHARLSHDQRYCLQCGTRRGPLPRPVAEMLGSMLEQGHAPKPVARPAEWAFEPPRLPFGITFPSPRAASVAVLGMLAFGVIIGTSVTPNWQGLSVSSPLLVAVRPHINPFVGLSDSGASTGDGGAASAGGGGGGGGGVVTVTVVQSTQSPSGGSSAPAVSPLTSGGGPTAPANPSGSTPNQFGIPPVHHLFLIMLSDEGFNQSFGPGSQDAYLSKTLPAGGELIENYYGVAGGELANEIALLSGQGPTHQTAANCPTFAPVEPGKVIKRHQQVLGNGCVYPKATQTLPGELTAKKFTWKAYVGGIDLGPPGQPTSCRHPRLGAADPYHDSRAGDPYVTWLNPFMYFQSVIGSKACAKDVVGLGALGGGDLDRPDKAPSLAYIVPSPCSDGSETPCAPGATAGLAPADSFLQTVIPEIESSAAYKDNGAIAITFNQAPQTGSNADTRACCEYPAYPNLAPAARDDADRTPKMTTPVPPIASTPSDTTTPTTPTATTPTTTSTTPATTTPTTTSTTPATTTPTTTTPSSPFGGPPQTRPTGGGGQVGLLLISRYVRKGSIDAIDYYNHYSLLATIEDMFGLKPLGYAGVKSLPILDANVFNNVH